MEVTLNDVLYMVLTVAVPVLLFWLFGLIRAKTNGTKYELVVDAVLAAVEAVNQVFVDELKKHGKFTEQAQQQALMMAMSKAKEIMGDTVLAWFTKTYGDVDAVLTTLIESAVRSLK